MDRPPFLARAVGGSRDRAWGACFSRGHVGSWSRVYASRVDDVRARFCASGAFPAPPASAMPPPPRRRARRRRGVDRTRRSRRPTQVLAQRGDAPVHVRETPRADDPHRARGRHDPVEGGFRRGRARLLPSSPTRRRPDGPFRRAPRRAEVPRRGGRRRRESRRRESRRQVVVQVDVQVGVQVDGLCPRPSRTPPRRMPSSFRAALADADVSATATWQDASRAIANDPRRDALKTAGEKRRCLHEYQARRGRRIARRVASPRKPRGRLLRDASRTRERRVRRDSNRRRVDDVAPPSSSPGRRGRDSNRRAVRRDSRRGDARRSVPRVSRRRRGRRRDARRENRRDAANACRELLLERGVDANARWREISAICADDPRSTKCDAEDRLETFASVVGRLRDAEDEVASSARVSRRRVERINREAFVALLDSKRRDGSMALRLPWRVFVETQLADEPAYENAARNASGSRPRELYEDAQEEMERDAEADRHAVEAAARECGVVIDQHTDAKALRAGLTRRPPTASSETIDSRRGSRGSTRRDVRRCQKRKSRRRKSRGAEDRQDRRRVRRRGRDGEVGGETRGAEETTRAGGFRASAGRVEARVEVEDDVGRRRATIARRAGVAQMLRRRGRSRGVPRRREGVVRGARGAFGGARGGGARRHGRGRGAPGRRRRRRRGAGSEGSDAADDDERTVQVRVEVAVEAKTTTTTAREDAGANEPDGAARGERRAAKGG